MDHMLKECSGEKTILGLIRQYKDEECYSIHSKFKATLEEWLLQFL